MCGRFLNKLPAAEIARIFRTSNPLPNYPARYKIAPTQPVLTVRFNPETKERSLDSAGACASDYSQADRGPVDLQTLVALTFPVATCEETLRMIEVRPAHPGDATKVHALLVELGYDVPVEDVRKRLGDLAARQTDPVLLAAEADVVLGLIAMHWTIMLHVDKPVARITALIVRADARGKGVGRTLVDAGAELAGRAGCGLVELTTALDRAEAHTFYKGMGFTASSLRFYRTLADKPIH